MLRESVLQGADTGLLCKQSYALVSSECALRERCTETPLYQLFILSFAWFFPKDVISQRCLDTLIFLIALYFF